MIFGLSFTCVFVIGVLLLIGRIIATLERMSKKLLSLREDLEKQNDEIKRLRDALGDMLETNTRLHLTISEIEAEREYLLSELRRHNAPSENISKK